MDKLNEIKARLAKAAHKEKIDESMNLRDLGIDSLDIVEMLLDLETELNIHFDEMDMSNLVTVKDLLDAVAKQLK